MDSDAYAHLAHLHSQLARQLGDVRKERDFLRQRISALTGEIFPATSDMTVSAGAIMTPNILVPHFDLDDHQSSSSGSPPRKKSSRHHTQPKEIQHLMANDFIYGQVQFSYHAFSLLEQLFRILDTSGKGCITKEDFSSDSFQGMIVAMGAWAEMKSFFDADNSGSIDPAEFITGFWKWNLSQQINLPGVTINYASAIELLNRHANEKVVDLINLTFNNLASTVSPRRVNHSHSSKQQPPIACSMMFSMEIVNSLATLFSRLDDKKKGEITMDSFLAAQGNVTIYQGLGTWEELRAAFDTDKSGSINQKEFVLGFKKWLLSCQITLPQASITLQQFINHVSDSANVTLKQLVQVFHEKVGQK
eukprot:c11624_g1_i1.p1 GENE.c11624_g1_i1~~c11624_g1_i1.p1  ORF type:complete len:362 (-),score=155.34 c11624_g1_i1:20-1105(-)